MKPKGGWVGRILRVDLTSGRVSYEDTMRYAADFLGGRGMNAKIAWEEIPPGIDAFDAENRLIAMTGPLTGTATPGAGRVVFGGVAPQVYPQPRYTRSGMGGHWGAVLKYAGYDGVIVSGRAARPVYLWITDGDVEIRDAGWLWGLDTYSAQRLLLKRHGADAVAITIGPAGERGSRIAIIANETENAAGQGGFGGVMGSKQLKAIVVKGEGAIEVADAARFLAAYRRVRKYIAKNGATVDLCGAQVASLTAARLAPYLGKYEQKLVGCAGCPVACAPGLARAFCDVPGRVYPGLNTSVNTCVETRWTGGTGRHYETGHGWGIPHPAYEGAYPELPRDLPVLDFEAGFECAVLGNKYGVNMWEVTLGLVPWIKLCADAGILSEKEVGMPIDVGSGRFWCEVLRKIAYREGVGDALAEGVPRAADLLGKGHPYLTHMAHGYVEHIVGRGIQTTLPFPLWVTTALIWATESRDPVSELHSSTRISTARGLTAAQAKALSRAVYGTEKTVEASYEGKAPRAIWHQNRGCAKDSLVLCDAVYPIVMSEMTEDRGGYTAAESEFFAAVTGIEMDEAALDRVGERIFNVERAIMVREGRSKAYDLTCGVVRYLTQRPDTAGLRLDAAQFTRALEDYYRLRGWDVDRGWPTKETLRSLGLPGVVEELDRRGAVLVEEGSDR
jgi:aldehyde:ferredoxin oxidoreductase